MYRREKQMSEQKFFYSSAYLLAAPVAALIIGVTLGQAYCSKHVTLGFRWGNNAATLLALAFIVIILRENYASIIPPDVGVTKTGSSQRPLAAQVFTPAAVGCVQFLVQVYHIQQFLKAFGKRVWTVVCLLICVINFLVSWACTITILIKLSNPPEVIDLSETKLPTFQLESHVLAAWLATSLSTELIIVACNLYSGRIKHNTSFDKPICFLKNDHISTKAGVVALQTSALSALVILTVSSIFLVDVLSEGQPSAGMTGCFIFLQLMRIPVGYTSLVFSVIRERDLSINAIRQSLIETPNDTLKDFSLEEYKKSDTTNQVTVHTVTSQVFEN